MYSHIAFKVIQCEYTGWVPVLEVKDMSSGDKAKRDSTPVVVRFRPAEVKRIDRVALANGRSRSSEVRLRVLASLTAKARA